MSYPQRAAAFLLALATCYSLANGKTLPVEAEILLSRHGAPRLPYALVADAGSLAANLSPDQRIRLQFIQSYADGAKEALVWGPDHPEFTELSESCANATILELKATFCGYTAGFVAIQDAKLGVTLVDFGYVARTIYGEIGVQEWSQIKFVQVTYEKPWVLVNSKQFAALLPNRCYRMRGYLSSEGASGGRALQFTREFIPLTAEPADWPCANPR